MSLERYFEILFTNCFRTFVCWRCARH